MCDLPLVSSRWTESKVDHVMCYPRLDRFWSSDLLGRAELNWERCVNHGHALLNAFLTPATDVKTHILPSIGILISLEGIRETDTSLPPLTCSLPPPLTMNKKALLCLLKPAHLFHLLRWVPQPQQRLSRVDEWPHSKVPGPHQPQP